MENSKKIIASPEGLTLLELIIIVAVIIGGGYYFLSEHRLSSKQQEKISRRDIVAKELANKYQATMGWEENLDYTWHAQKRMIAGKPILFRGDVTDIFGRDGKIFVRFSSSFLAVSHVLELECSRQIVRKIFAQEPDREFFVVANIQEVTPGFTLEGSTLNEGEVVINQGYSNLFMVMAYNPCKSGTL